MASVRSFPRTVMALLNPPGACRNFTRSGSSYPPLGLAQLASTVERTSACVVDADGERWDDETTLSVLLHMRPKAIGLSVTSKTMDMTQRWGAVLKERLSPLLRNEPVIIVGGPHASILPHDVLQKCPAVDGVVRGEAEVMFPSLVSRLEHGQDLKGLPGLMLRDHQDKPPPEILRVPQEDFQALPFPAKDFLPVHNYWCPDARRRPLFTFMTSRGCPFRCGFCSSPALLGKKVRGWDVKDVLDELERLKVDHGVEEISFTDDVFTAIPSRTLELCRGMVERGLGLSWFCNARADQVSPTLAHAMAEAGCHQTYLGFESGNSAMLKFIRKGATLPILERGATILKEAGINRSVGFVVGLPGETDATVGETIELALRVRPERIQFSRWTPLAGSPLVEAGYGSGGRGFHDVGVDDQISRWISRCYSAVEQHARNDGGMLTWGLPSI